MLKWMSALLLLGLSAPMGALAQQVVLDPVELGQDHGYEAPVLESKAWVVLRSRDEAGNLVETLEPLDAMSVLPGMMVVYEFSLVNPLDDVLTNIVLNNPFPETIRLQEASVAGPLGMLASYSVKVPAGDAETDAEPVYYPIYPLPAEDVLNQQPSVERIDMLRLTLQLVPAQSRVFVKYAGTVRTTLSSGEEAESSQATLPQRDDYQEEL